MTKPIAPKTLEAATELLERYAVLEGRVAAIVAKRARIHARASAAADKAANPLIDEMAAICAQLAPWWKTNAAELTAGKRKSMTIGGCSIGTKLSATVLAFTNGDDDAALEALKSAPWAKGYVTRTVTYKIDKPATLAAMDGKKAEQLKALGFAKQGGEDMFFVKRAAQGGTRA